MIVLLIPNIEKPKLIGLLILIFALLISTVNKFSENYCYIAIWF